MLVDPAFFTHWKTQMVADAIGGDFALERACFAIQRLWGHCQTRKAWTFQIPTKGLALLCGFSGDAQVLEDALIEAGWITRDGEAITVVGWEEHNKALVTRWENGRKGGRSKEPAKNREGTELEPGGTGNEPAMNRQRTGKQAIGQDRKRVERNAAHCSPPKPPQGGGSAPDAAAIDEAFERWWKRYPSREGCPKGNKSQAREAFARIPRERWADLRRATDRLIESGSLPPDAERFLRSPRNKGDPRWVAWLDDSEGPVVPRDPKTKSAAERREERNDGDYDTSWTANAASA